MGRWVGIAALLAGGVLLVLAVAFGLVPMLWWGWDVPTAVDHVRPEVIPVVGMAVGNSVFGWWSERKARKRTTNGLPTRTMTTGPTVLPTYGGWLRA